MNVDANVLEDLNATVEAIDEESIVVSCAPQTREEWKCWLAQFSAATNTSWNVRKTFPNVKRLVFKQSYVCHCNQYRQYSSINKKRLQTNCPAKIVVQIHFRCGTFANTRPERPCVVTISGKHNHSSEIAENFCNLQVHESTKTVFCEYFAKGLTAGQALHFHQTKLWVSEGFAAVAKTSINPKPSFVYYLWKQWRQQQFGSYHGENMFSSIADYASKNEEITIKLEQFQSSFICVVITPLMQRVHKLLKTASEIVFVDSTSNLDQTQSSLTILLCAAPIGAITLGAIVLSYQEQDSYT